ncbi:MAG: hypothetical protein ACHQET_08115 [Chitinophagales bacterium]
MSSITNDHMKEMMTKTKNYSVVILKAGPNLNQQDTPGIIWEHGRRNFELRASGKLSIVCPVTDTSDVKGIGIFNVDQTELKEIMDNDPGVKAGIFLYEIHSVRSFPGDQLP